MPHPLSLSLAPSRSRKWRSRRFLGLAAAFLGGFLGQVAFAGEDRWTPFGPSGGSLDSLVASPGGEVYVTTSYAAGEIWQRPTANVPWRWRGHGLGKPGAVPIALAIHPLNPKALWAVATITPSSETQAVYRSTDAGATWRRLSVGDADFRVIRLTIAPTRNSVVLFAETGGHAPKRLLRSTDLGVTWMVVPGRLGPVAAPPGEPGTVYAVAASGSGIDKSVDGGKTFGPTAALPVDAEDAVLALHATYGRPSIVLASLRAGGLFRSLDGGRSWRRSGFSGEGPSALASEPANPKKIYAAVSGLGLYQSQKGGQVGSFVPIAGFAFTPLQIVAVTHVAAAPGGPYFLAGSELYRPAPQHSFAPVEAAGIEAFGVLEVRIHPLDSRYQMVRTFTRCLDSFCLARTLLSTDGGTTFTRLGAQIQPRRFLDFLDLAFDPNEPRRWLIATGLGSILHDPGDPGLGHSIGGGPGTSATVEFTAGGALLVGGFFGIQWSEDQGVTWTTSLDGTIPPSPEHPAGGRREITELTANPFDPSRVIARTLEYTTGLPRETGKPVLYKSADAGKSWTLLRQGIADVEFIPGAPASFYLLVPTASRTELRRSDDFGDTSNPIRSFDLAESARDIAADPSAPGVLYLASARGVTKSVDGGLSFQPTAGGFNPFGPYRQWVGAVQVAPDGRLIASPVDGGLFQNRLSDR